MHAARIRLIQTGDQVERRALAAPGGPEQGHERASRDLQGKLVDGADLPEVAPKTVEAERGAADYRRSLQRRAGAQWRTAAPAASPPTPGGVDCRQSTTGPMPRQGYARRPSSGSAQGSSCGTPC